MTELEIPKRRFAPLRQFLRTRAPTLYGNLLASKTARRLFAYIKGRETILLQGDLAERFTLIYNKQVWVDDESRSGGGSNLYATEKIRKAIPILVDKYRIRSILDIPCGDFFWFKEMILPIERYIGGDIVQQLIDEISVKYAAAHRSFAIIDITKDELPSCDLLLSRDCFIHLSNPLIFSAFHNIARADITHLLATHNADTMENLDIEPGMCRPVNFCIAPFHFPPPLELIDDYAVAQLALWRVPDLCPLIARMPHS
jgi:hypothetical protein